MVDPSTALGIVQSVRSKYPTPLGALHAQFLLEVAAKLHAGLLKKDTGTNILLPDGTRVAQDIVMDKVTLTHYDILSDGEGAANPVFNSDGPMDENRYYPVAASGDHVDPPVGPPADNPLDALITAIKADLASLSGRATSLETSQERQDQDLVAQVRGLQGQITAIATQEVVLPPLEVKFSLLGRQLTLPVTERK